MSTISYTTARGKLAKTMDRVCENGEAVVITRAKQPSGVMISLEDYEALSETAHLLRSPKNARRLLAATAQLEARKGRTRKLNLDT